MQAFYEAVTWLVILVISAVWIFLSYLLTRLAFITQRKQWKWLFYGASVGAFALGLWRVIAAVVYFESYTARLTFPATAFISWIGIAVIGYAVVRWAETAASRLQTSKRGIELMDEIQAEVVEPLLRKELVSKAVIEHYRTVSASLK